MCLVHFCVSLGCLKSGDWKLGVTMEPRLANVKEKKKQNLGFFDFVDKKGYEM